MAGVAVYSSFREEIGGGSKRPELLSRALRGKIEHKIEHRDEFNGKNGLMRDIYVSMTYQPYMHEGRQIGVVEIYDDASQIYSAIYADSIKIFLVVFGSFSVLFIALSFYISRADHAITDWQQAVASSEALLAAILESALDAVIRMDSSGNITAWNRRAEQILGWSKEEAIGRPLHELLIPDQYRDSHIQGLKHYLATGESAILNKQLEMVALRRDGREFPIELAVLPIKIKLDYKFCAFIRDITEKKFLENVMLRHRQVVETALDGFWLVDRHGNLLEVNSAYAKMSGYTTDELKGMHISQLEASESPKEVEAHIRKIIAEGSGRFETRHRRKDGKVIEIEVATTYMPNIQQFFVFCRDITRRKEREDALRLSEERLSFALQGANDGLWDWNLETNEVYYSPRWLEMLGYLPGELPQTLDTWATLVHPEDKDRTLVLVHEYISGNIPAYAIEFRMRHKRGYWLDILSRARMARDKNGQLLCPRRLVGTHVDISERKRTESQLRVAAVAFETDEAILITNAQANIIRVNQAFTRLTGYQPEEVLGKNPRILSSGRMDMAFFAGMWKELLDTGTWSGEIWDRRKSGEIYPKWMTITAVKNEEGNITEFVGMFTDITERKKAEEEIRNLAFYDALTGLPNRRLLMDRLHLAVSASERNKHYGAVLFLDLDKFKILNDTLGHDYGDLMLLEVATRIQSCVREADTVARLGGDEFVALIEEISTNREDASQKVAVVAEKIRLALSEPYQLKGHVYHSSPSIGITLFKGNRKTLEELLKQADLAMYQAKESGRNAVQFFDPAMQQILKAHAALERDLRQAIVGNQLFLYYQIQVDSDIKPFGAEALLRWVHPERGMVLPAEFISIAESSSLILEIGQWVLDAACRQLALWSRHEQTCRLELAINISARQFALPGFVQQVAEAVRRHDITPSHLKLELTESVVLKDMTEVAAKMHALKAMGVKLSLDDFGTGYSSLFYLKNLPLDQIKIDRSFVRDTASNPSDAMMVKTIIDLAQNFRLNVLAEGVETTSQLTFLRQNGCMAYQGHLFNKPMPLLEFEAVICELAHR